MEKIEGVIEISTDNNFSEEGYLLYNADIKMGVDNKILRSGLDHFKVFGKNENRLQYNPNKLAEIEALRNSKLNKLKLKYDYPHDKINNGKISFLTEDLKKQFHIIQTSNVSSNNYDPEIMKLIDKYKDGIILDCGAGERSSYYSNVVNYEIANYWSTDILGVGEKLPFDDETFDAVISVAVLEHVKDPFLSSKEITRVLKKGGILYSAIPFLQPYHGYPHHYYNMTHQGHKNLYEDAFTDLEVKVSAPLKPIFTLSWFLNSYCNGLPDKVKNSFMDMSVKDLIGLPTSYLAQDFVKELSTEANFELAAGTVLVGKKI